MSVTEDDLQRLVDGGTSEAAKKATAHWLRVVAAFRQGQGDKICFATCSAEECSDFLCRFCVRMRPKGEGEYRRISYLSARAAIQRHLRVIRRPFNIFKDKPFRRSNEVPNGILPKRKKGGLEPNVRHKEAVSEGDMAKLSDYFADVLDFDDPRKLTQYCWFCITIHFCLRGQEIYVGLKKTDIVFEENGSIRLGTDFLSSNW